ncbi:MAG TPA: hypothetical protein PKH69_07385 [Thiobacillaceae bacterium]|nr:hypothetical protein [Thiobacillaceae bacterium]HNU64078.1 hypothetical protein [Thiobacillaceae bacterium]
MKFDAAIKPYLSAPRLFDGTIRLLGMSFTVLALVLAGHWLTQFTAPRPLARLPASHVAQPQDRASQIGLLFGRGEGRPAAAEGLLLTGVFAGTGGGGFATFQTPGGAVSAVQGNEVAPGVRLMQIKRDHVILLTTESQRELRLSARAAPSAVSANQTGTGGAAAYDRGTHNPQVGQEVKE